MDLNEIFMKSYHRSMGFHHEATYYVMEPCITDYNTGVSHNMWGYELFGRDLCLSS